MIHFNRLPHVLRSRAGAALATVGVAVLIAGCGSSGSDSTITVGNESTTDTALIKAGETSTGTTTTATTPTSGPLSTEPTVTPPSDTAPKTLITKDLIVGTGPEAKAGDTVTVNYVGVLSKGGKPFDASWNRKEPFTFALGKGQVIAGWDQGDRGHEGRRPA